MNSSVAVCPEPVRQCSPGRSCQLRMMAAEASAFKRYEDGLRLGWLKTSKSTWRLRCTIDSWQISSINWIAMLLARKGNR